MDAPLNAPRYWDDYEVGRKYPLGSTTFTEQEIVDFARLYDPQEFHVDAAAAKESFFGGLIASGWQVCSKLMRLFVDNYLDKRTALGSPGVDEIRWLKPVRPGDTLTAWVECAAKVPSRSKPHGVARVKWTAYNQNGEAVYTFNPIAIVPSRTEGNSVS